MQPADSFWDGVGKGISNSPWWAIVGTGLVIGIVFLIGKFIVPSLERYRMKKVESEERIRMRELEVREREAQNDRDRIKANAALAENMRGLRESNDQLAKQSAALTAGIEESKIRSRSMGDEVAHTKESVDHIRDTTDDTCAMVREIHTAVVAPHRAEGTD